MKKTANKLKNLHKKLDWVSQLLKSEVESSERKCNAGIFCIFWEEFINKIKINYKCILQTHSSTVFSGCKHILNSSLIPKSEPTTAQKWTKASRPSSLLCLIPRNFGRIKAKPMKPNWVITMKNCEMKPKPFWLAFWEFWKCCLRTNFIEFQDLNKKKLI